MSKELLELATPSTPDALRCARRGPTELLDLPDVCAGSAPVSTAATWHAGGCHGSELLGPRLEMHGCGLDGKPRCTEVHRDAPRCLDGKPNPAATAVPRAVLRVRTASRELHDPRHVELDEAHRMRSSSIFS